MLLAQISDCHIGADQVGSRPVDAGRQLRACLVHMQALPRPPQAVLATGDLVHNAAPAEYQAFRACIADLDVPLYLLPGNHDDRAALRAAFTDHAYLGAGDGPVSYVAELASHRLVVVDTVVPGAEFGRIGRDRLAWLDRTLARLAPAPVLLALHHPPFAIGLHRMDRIACENGADLAAVVAAHDHVVRILCGHTHRYAQTVWAGRAALSAPSTLAQLEVNLGAGGRAEWNDEPPAYLLHDLDAPGIVTHLCQVPMPVPRT